jgi:phosphoglycerate kinase
LQDAARRIERKLAERGKQLWLPEDVVTADRFAADATVAVREADAVREGEMILDIGPRARASLAELVRSAGTVVWNGPVGVFEMAPFSAGTGALAEAVAACSGFTIAGGGDTLAAVAAFGVTDRIGYVSTGGGAFLEFLEGRELPAVAALRKAHRGPLGRTVAPRPAYEFAPEIDNRLHDGAVEIGLRIAASAPAPHAGRAVRRSVRRPCRRPGRRPGR